LLDPFSDITPGPSLQVAVIASRWQRMGDEIGSTLNPISLLQKQTFYRLCYLVVWISFS